MGADVTQISIGPFGFGDLCALLGDGGVRCMPTGVASLPTDIPLDAGAVQVLSSAQLSCALLVDGRISCWRELANPSAFTIDDVPNLRAVRLGGVARPCGVTAAGEVMCWGWFDFTPQPDWVGLPVERLFSNASGAACAVITDGGVTCGFRQPSSPMPGPAVEVSIGEFCTCGRIADGGMYCWGSGQHGVLGTGDEVSRPAPTLVPGLPAGVKSLGVSETLTCAVTVQGELFCWGEGPLGTGQAKSWTPQRVLAPGEGRDSRALQRRAVRTNRFVRRSREVAGELLEIDSR